jgi:hypothetical protein
MAAVVSANGQSQLRRSTEDSLQTIEQLFDEDIVMPMIKVRAFFGTKIQRLDDHRWADVVVTRLLFAERI